MGGSIKAGTGISIHSSRGAAIREVARGDGFRCPRTGRKRGRGARKWARPKAARPIYAGLSNMPRIVEAYQYVEPRRVRQPICCNRRHTSRRLNRSRPIHKKTSRTMCASSSTTSKRATAAPHGLSHHERDILTAGADYMRQREQPAAFLSVEAGREPGNERIVRGLTRKLKSVIAQHQRRAGMRRTIFITVFEALGRDKQPKFGAPFPLGRATKCQWRAERLRAGAVLSFEGVPAVDCEGPRTR
jgi:hypothetical protein